MDNFLDGMVRFTGYALAVLIVLGLIGIDTYLILDLLKQPALLWWHLAAGWGVAFTNIIFMFLATIVFGAARMGG